MREYLANDIVITSLGVVLPDTPDYEEFKKKCFAGDHVFSDIDDDRWQKDYSYSENKAQEDKTYSSLASQIKKDFYISLREKHGLDKENDHRMIAYLADAYDQVIRGLGPDIDVDNMSLILGAMNPDERLFKERLIDLIERAKINFRKEHPDFIHLEYVDKIIEISIREMTGNIEDITREGQFPTSVFSRLKEIRENDFNGEGWIVDSACSSSLTSLEIGINLLKTKAKKIVIAGGVESNLSNGAFVIFSKVGALTSSISRPFDVRHDGIVQGEGAVLFALERLEDALHNNRKIFGVLRKVDGASDGRSASLFQPTVEGQILAYDKVWSQISGKPFFVESHGTGTEVGDEVEKLSLASYFKDHDFHVGAIKGIYGHTKSTAGAVGILKGLAIFETNTIPGNKFIEETIFDDELNITMNRENTLVDTSHEFIGVSSLGFGGCNYHAALQRYNPEYPVVPTKDESKKIILDVIKTASLSLDEVAPEKMSRNYFPPKSFNQIDKMQIGAVECMERMFPDTTSLLKSLGSTRINVVSCGRLCLSKLDDLVDRITIDCLLEKSKQNYENESPEGQEILNILMNFANKFKHTIPTINEDYGPGILNNVIAGRVANVFNLHGKSYHVDMDLGSLDAALLSIGLELCQKQDQIYFLIDTTGEFDEARKEYRSDKLKIYMLCHPDITKIIGLGKEGTFIYE